MNKITQSNITDNYELKKSCYLIVKKIIENVIYLTEIIYKNIC